jgi:hypothetical protein
LGDFHEVERFQHQEKKKQSFEKYFFLSLVVLAIVKKNIFGET